MKVDFFARLQETRLGRVARGDVLVVMGVVKQVIEKMIERDRVTASTPP